MIEFYLNSDLIRKSVESSILVDKFLQIRSLNLVQPNSVTNKCEIMTFPLADSRFSSCVKTS